MDEHDRLFHPHWQGLHPPPPRVHPFLTRSRRLRRRRRAQRPRSRKSKASSVLRSFTDDVPDCQSNLASSPSPSALSPPLMHRYVHSPHSESQWASEGMVSTCMSRVVRLPRVASPFRAWSSRRGKATSDSFRFFSADGRHTFLLHAMPL